MCANTRSCAKPAREGYSSCESCAANKRRTHHRNKERYNLQRNLRQYGLTVEQFDQMVEQQGGLCAICDQPCAHYSRLSVDHCHDTGRVRGLLCNNCNRGIGLLGDDAKRMERAMTYLSAA